MLESYPKIFELCISMITALLGLSYPLFIDKIDNMTEKYNTRYISEKFTNETSYCLFNTLMIVCIVEMFTFPVIIHAYQTEEINLLLITIQAICVFTLSIVMFKLFHLLMVYTNPFRFFRRIRLKDKDEELFKDLQVLIQYASKNKSNQDVFNDTMSELIKQTVAYQETELKKKEDGNEILFIYPPYIVNSLNQLISKSTEEKDGFLYKNTDIVHVLYNQFNEFPITEQVYEMMWRWIYRMVDAGNEDWMKQYWNIANQYYMSKLEYSDKGKERKCFCEFHIMVCTLLLYKRRYRILRHTLSFTNTLPAQYPLIPGSFAEIFGLYEELTTQKPEIYLEKYQMDEVDNGANTGNKIIGLLADYFALLLMRLYEENILQTSLSDPSGMPVVGSTIEEIGYKVDLAEELKRHLDKITEKEKKGCLLQPDDKKNALKLLEDFITVCKETKKYFEGNGNISEKKQADIKKQLINAFSANALSLPINEKKQKQEKNSYNGKKYESLPQIFSQQIKLDERLILDNHSSMSSNIGEAMISALNFKIRRFYYLQFLLHSAIKSFTIPYNDLEKALKKLELSGDYALLAIGVPSSIFNEIKEFSRSDDKQIFYNTSPVYEIPYHKDSVFLIMKKEDVPYCKYLEIETGLDADEKKIDDQRHLYSNIDAILKDDLILKVKQQVEISLPKPMRFIRLRIAYRLESDNLITSQINSIKNYIL